MPPIAKGFCDSRMPQSPIREPSALPDGWTGPRRPFRRQIVRAYPRPCRYAGSGLRWPLAFSMPLALHPYSLRRLLYSLAVEFTSPAIFGKPDEPHWGWSERSKGQGGVVSHERQRWPSGGKRHAATISCALLAVHDASRGDDSQYAAESSACRDERRLAFLSTKGAVPGPSRRRQIIARCVDRHGAVL